jgi:hypothetical protein
MKPTLWIDQYGQKYRARTVKELRGQIGGGGSRVSKMYCDKKTGGTVQTGYVIGPHWLMGFVPWERVS